MRAHDRPTGPQVPPTRVATSLVKALRAARGALPWTAGTISHPANLDQESISSTISNRQSCSPPSLITIALELVITIAWNA